MYFFFDIKCYHKKRKHPLTNLVSQCLLLKVKFNNDFRKREGRAIL